MSDAVAHSPQALAAHGANTIAKGSTSFAMASLLFGKEMQGDVQMLYAWCRHCDDVIDGQDHGVAAPDISLDDGEQFGRLKKLKRDTRRALDGEATGDPAFDGFSIVARKHGLPQCYPMDLLDGFAMDVARREYCSMDDTLQYCYGVAGAVGIMMAIVMGVAADDDATLDRACDLGLAFQLTNICRDIIDDAGAGRIYLPADLLRAHNIDQSPQSIMAPQNRQALAAAAADLLNEADRYYASASAGLCMLPPRAAAAVAAARNVYRDIGRLVRARGAGAWDARVYTSKGRKAFLALAGSFTGAPQSLLMSSKTAPARGALWRRPRRQ